MDPSAYCALLATNKKYHNYCEDKAIPIGIAPILGLGLKFCIKKPRPPVESANILCDRLDTQVRRIAYFSNREVSEDEYNPKLYLPSKWKPKPADKEIEEALAEFRALLKKNRVRYLAKANPSLSNIFPSQGKLIKSMKKHDKYIIIQADKNLGAVIMYRDTYITRGVSEHLSNTDVYRLLNTREVEMHKARLRILLREFIAKHRPLLPNENPEKAITSAELTKAETTYLRRALESQPRNFARFRMTLKAHKIPYKMRPIVCCAGTLLNHLSKWLDFQLQKLTQLIPSYLKDSHELLTKLKAIGLLPPNAKLFTADAKSMYTNIDTDHAISVISSWIDSHSSSLPSDFPVNAVKDAMRLVMKNNIFEWGDTHFLQLLGTAMGTSAACMWATVYYGVHKTATLIPGHSTSLILYVRYIDDIFGIWTGDELAWQAFKADINSFGMLTWDISEPSTSVDFLDLTITVQPNG